MAPLDSMPPQNTWLGVALPPASRRLTPAAAEALVRWYLNESEGEACGLRAAAWNHTEEVTASSEVPRGRGDPRDPGIRLALAAGNFRPAGSAETVHVGAQTRAYHEVDVYPEHTAWARARLRRVHAVWARLTPVVQAVLEARFGHDGGRRPTVQGCGAVGRVVELLAEVREVAEARKVTPREACAGRGMKARLPELAARAEDAVQAALGAFAEAWGSEGTREVDGYAARLTGAAA